MLGVKVFSTCAILLILAVVYVALKELSNAYALIFGVLVSAILLCYVLLNAQDLMLSLEKMTENIGIKNSYFNVLLKILGICTLVQFTSSSLKDAGESCLAFNAELLGKFLIVYVSFPIFLEIINLMVKLTS